MDLESATAAVGPLPRSQTLRAALCVNQDDTFFSALPITAADPSSPDALPFQQFLSSRHDVKRGGFSRTLTSGDLRMQDLAPIELSDYSQIVIVPVGSVPGGREKLDALCSWSSALLSPLPVTIREVVRKAFVTMRVLSSTSQNRSNMSLFSY
jgi:hypothetical protein